MRPHRLRLRAIAAWLGIVALGFNALVPVHLAFDLSHAFETGHRHAGENAAHGLAWSVLTLLTGHDEHRDPTGSHHHHRHADCAVCGALGTLAGFAPAAAAILALPVRLEAPTLIVAAGERPHAAPPAAYRSRAPPAPIG